MVIALRKRFLFEVRLRWEAVGCVPDDETEKQRCHERGGSSDSSRPMVISSRAGTGEVILAGIVLTLWGRIHRFSMRFPETIHTSCGGFQP